MKERDTSDNSGAQKYKEITIVYSNNLRCYEQQNFLDDTRTFVLITTNTKGYVAVGAKVKDWRYITLRRWVIEYPGALSFAIPSVSLFRLKTVSVTALVERYQDVRAEWETVSREKRSHVVLAVPHGNTHR